MSRSSVLWRRLAGTVLLFAVLAAAGGLHQHGDLFGTFQGAAPGAATERTASSHSPLSKAAHWHTGVSVKEDPCLACHVQRMPGLSSDVCAGAQPTILQFTVAIVTVAPGSAILLFGGSRAPPALL